MKHFLSILLTILLTPLVAGAQEAQTYEGYVRAIEEQWDAYQERRDLEEFQREQDAALQDFQRQEQEAYQRFVEDVERKWNEFLDPTREEWVDYDDEKDTRSIVNFEEKETPEDDKGQITVEAIVPADEPEAEEIAMQKIAEQIEELVSSTNEAEQNVLEGQVKTEAGEDVTPENVEEFVREEVLPEVKVHPEPIKSQDGVERIRVSVVIPMVPDHHRVRAERYLPIVRAQGRQNRLDLPMVMATIQTESYFNPLAKSPIPAYGLMQLVPNSGGRDAYREVFKEDKAPTPNFLYVPENNVMLGSAYCRLLRERYLYGVKDPEKKELLAIAAYNGGIGRVIKRVLKKHNVPALTPSELYDVLRDVMPTETADYLEKVTSRQENYLAWRDS